MNMQLTCAAMLEEIDGALGCMVIDMQTGLTVAAVYRPGSVIDAAAINLVAVISTNMFGGKMIRQFENVLERRRERPAGFVREVQMTTATTNQFMAAVPGWDEGVFVLVTDKTVSLGLGWMAMHRMIGRVGEEGAAWAAPNPQPAPAPQASTRGAAAAPSQAWLPAEPSQRHPIEPARHPAQAPTIPPDPYGRPVQPLVAQPRDAGTAASPAEAAQAPPAAAAAEQSAPLVAPADQQQPEDEPEQRVAMGPRMNFMARKRRSTRK